MSINTETYVKLQYDDYKIIETVMNEVETLNADETLVLSKVKKIIQLMKTKYDKMKEQSQEIINDNE